MSDLADCYLSIVALPETVGLVMSTFDSALRVRRDSRPAGRQRRSPLSSRRNWQNRISPLKAGAHLLAPKSRSAQICTLRPRSPWQNAFCERIIGSLRKEKETGRFNVEVCPDFSFLGETQLTKL
ncbi:MAG: transposase InsO family protein [Planctomycetota bacterium]|jgi:transposase InsO family protein